MAKFEGMVLSNSKGKTWRRCPKSYDYKYNQRIEPVKRKVNLELGTWIHELVEVHYQGKNWRKRHKKLKKKWVNMQFDDPEAGAALPQEAYRLMESYLMRYKAEDKHWRVIATELNETIDMPNGLKFNFVIDLVIEEHGNVWIVDHRAVRSFMDEGFFMMDAVMARYFYAAKVIGLNPTGVMFNEIRTKVPTVPRMLQRGGLSQRRIDTDFLTYYRAIKANGLDPGNYNRMLVHLSRQRDKFFKRTHLPKSKALMVNTMADLYDTADEIRDAKKKRRYPRSNDKSCRWCDYLKICQVEYHGGDASQIIQYDYKKRSRRGKVSR